MKKWLPYIIAGIVIVLLGALIISSKKNAPKKLNERISLKQSDRIPYGTSAARQLLPTLFPGANVYYDSQGPGNWDSLSLTSYNQAVFLVTLDFEADISELENLAYFARHGNYVFIIAKTLSYDAQSFFNLTYDDHSFTSFMQNSNDSLQVKLEPPFFQATDYFHYPGKAYQSSFASLDSSRTLVLGKNEYSSPNFIQMKAGNGAVFIHVAPLAFSNYFILHRNNVRYFQEALSVIPDKVEKILWNEYYLTKPKDNSEEKEPNIFRVLFRYEAFRWGLITGLLALIIMALLGSRRKQRIIPEYSRPRNDSLDFVKTLGRLYHDRRDHQNLARKMGIYFLENVRSTYKLATHNLDEDFIKNLHYKSGYPVEEISAIVSFIQYLERTPQITEKQLSDFHNHLEKFYQNT